MTDFFGIPNPGLRAYSGSSPGTSSGSTSGGHGSIVPSGYIDGIDFNFALLEGRFPDNSGAFPHNDTGFQSTTNAVENMPGNSAYLGGLTMSDSTTYMSSSSFAPAPVDNFAYIYASNFHSGPHVNMQQTETAADPSAHRILQPQNLDFSWPIVPNSFNSTPSSLRDGIGDLRNLPHGHEALAPNLFPSLDVFPDLGTPATGQVPHAPRWDRNDFTSQTQWDNDALMPAPVEMSASISPSSTSTNPYRKFIRTSTATKIIEGVGRAGSVLGKRTREYNGSRLPEKRGRHVTSRDLEAEGYAKKTHRTPATRARQQDIYGIYDSTKQSGEAHPVRAQRLPSNLLSGTSALQETVGSSEKGQSEEKFPTQHDSCSMQQIALQSGGNAEGRAEHVIPRTLAKRQLTDRQRSLLLPVTDAEGGAIRCRLCPTVVLSSWQCYRRHCDTSRDHPAKLTFCEQCGDYFGRPEAKKRHNTKDSQEECRKAPRDQAEQKKKMVEQLCEDFNARLKRRLETGKEIGIRFADMVAQAKVHTTLKEVRPGGDS